MTINGTLRPCQHDALMRMNHDQWPPVDPPGLGLDLPAWGLILVLAVLFIPVLIAAGVWEAVRMRWR